MKKIITTMTMVCLSFSCFAENYFVKIAPNKYVLQHGEKSRDLGVNNSGFGSVAPVDAVYTPTHIFTYPDGTPSVFRNIQKIDYTESNATFYKDIKTRKCCIDILDDKENANKCRVIGVNGHNIGSFEVYEVAGEANSFTDSTPRLIFVDHSGLYIVSEKENPIKDVSKNHFRDGSFDFKGEIIKISAIDGKREIPKCAFNCPSDVPVYFEESIPYSKSEFVPIMEQIREIAGVVPKSDPPTLEAAKHRMAEILDLPEEILVTEDEIIKIIGLGGVVIRDAEAKAYSNYKNVLDQLKSFFSIARKSMGNKWSGTMQKEVYKNYKFDTSLKAQQRRREIAQKPWDE